MGFARKSCWHWTPPGRRGGVGDGGGWALAAGSPLAARLCPAAPDPCSLFMCVLAVPCTGPEDGVRPPRPCPPGLESNGGGNHGGRRHSPHGAVRALLTHELTVCTCHPTTLQETSTEGLSRWPEGTQLWVERPQAAPGEAVCTCPPYGQLAHRRVRGLRC